YVYLACSFACGTRLPFFCLFDYFLVNPRYLHSFPTRRSSDLFSNSPFMPAPACNSARSNTRRLIFFNLSGTKTLSTKLTARFRRDRKSTRLNSSHVKTSYAVFCLKKKNTERRA